MKHTIHLDRTRPSAALTLSMCISLFAGCASTASKSTDTPKAADPAGLSPAHSGDSVPKSVPASTPASVQASDPASAPAPASASAPAKIAIDDKDARMRAAAEEARRRWPEFVEAVSSGNKKQKCIAKTGYPLPDGNLEYLWITVTQINASQVTGTVNTRPTYAADIQKDQTLTVESSSITDWIVAEGKSIKAGNFQSEVIRKIREEKAGR